MSNVIAFPAHSSTRVVCPTFGALALAPQEIEDAPGEFPREEPTRQVEVTPFPGAWKREEDKAEQLPDVTFIDPTGEHEGVKTRIGGSDKNLKNFSRTCERPFFHLAADVYQLASRSPPKLASGGSYAYNNPTRYYDLTGYAARAAQEEFDRVFADIFGMTPQEAEAAEQPPSFNLNVDPEVYKPEKFFVQPEPKEYDPVATTGYEGEPSNIFEEAWVAHQEFHESVRQAVGQNLNQAETRYEVLAGYEVIGLGNLLATAGGQALIEGSALGGLFWIGVGGEIIWIGVDILQGYGDANAPPTGKQ